MDFWRGSGGQLEDTVKEEWRIPSGTETYLVADGRVLNSLDKERLGDGKNVKITVSVRDGSREKSAKKGKKERNP